MFSKFSSVGKELLPSSWDALASSIPRDDVPDSAISHLVVHAS